MDHRAPTTIDQSEIDRFSAMASEWWSPTGKFQPLHKLNPVRLTYIRDQVSKHFGLQIGTSDLFAGLRILDIGCGGGLLCEPMKRLGADVTGADASDTNIEVAKSHARSSNLTIDYRVATAENLADSGETFDVVLNMEVVEHVADVNLFVEKCCQLVKPGGLMFVSTINRTLKAFGLAIVGAEMILQWLPRGTHHYDKLVKPQELESAICVGGMDVVDRTGVVYNPLADRWILSADMAVNYMVLAARHKS